MPKKLDLDKFSQINSTRAMRWHREGLAEWTTLEWAGAMCGEAGEAANIAKKLRRFDLGMQQQAVARSLRDQVTVDEQRAELVRLLAGEIAGTFIYLFLLAEREGIDFQAAVIEEFNRVSEREGFPERL